MSKAVNKVAAAHYALGALEKFLKAEPVPVGHHDLCNAEMTLHFPATAFVDRAEGTAGEGFDLGKPKEVPALSISLGALLLFEERCTEAEFKSDAKARTLMANCLRDNLKGMTAEPPAWATQALALVQAEQPEPEPVMPEPRKTSSKRTGDLEVEIEVRRPKAAVA